MKNEKLLKNERLLQAMGDLPDDMVLEAQPQEQVTGKNVKSERLLQAMGDLPDDMVLEAQPQEQAAAKKACRD